MWQGWAGLAVAAMLVGCGSVSKTDADPKAKQAAPADSATATAAAVATTEATTAAVAPPPTAKDFAVKVKTTKKDCFGSAGCVVEYHIEVSTNYVGDPDTEYLVTYEVSGVQDGPKINSFTFQGTKYSRDDTENAQTKKSSAKLVAKVTEVEQN